MNRRMTIILVAFVLFAALALYDRNNSTRMTLQATVETLEARDDTAGPDNWYLTVKLKDQSIELDPLDARPNIAVGDTICIVKIIREGQPDQYRRANTADGC